ncbi:MAG: hypothetical protein QOD39_4075, partial [Mycobacterium sp.]|nr:hypothetical protein [Mycobacterium sp.]
MRLVADSGLWSTGLLAEPGPLVAVLEVSGAVLSWTVDDPTRAVGMTFTDLTSADWLWRLLGESGHAAVAAALEGRLPHQAQTVELSGVDVRTASVEPLRRLALGHWLRRWWPASQRDGIVGLDAALLDAEIAVLTQAAQDIFTDDTFDSDVAGLIRPHSAALIGHAQAGDPRVVELVRACTDLADDIGVAFVEPTEIPVRRDDYALAAGSDTGGRPVGAIAGGVGSVKWGGVAPGVFDAAENTVEWHVEPAEGLANAVVRVELSGSGSPNGVDVRLQSGAVVGAGVLGADGLTTFALFDTEQHPITETAAWNHDWRTAAVSIGAGV